MTMTHPLAKQAQAELARATTPQKVMRTIEAWLERMCHLDQGMVEGRVLPRAELDALYAELIDVTRAAFLRAAAGDAIGHVVAKLGKLPVYGRPKRCDLAEWAAAAAAAPAPSAAPAAATAVLDDPALDPRLARAWRALVAMVAADPAHHRLDAPASRDALSQWEAEHRLTIPPDLCALYRLSDGFALHLGRRHADGAAVRLVALRELRPFADAAGEPRRRSRAKTDATLAQSNERLLTFDLGNGDFVSCLPLKTGRTLWIDDWREQPSPLSFATVAEVLEHLLSPERLDEHGTWCAGLS
jgi:hypothetical protein